MPLSSWNCWYNSATWLDVITHAVTQGHARDSYWIWEWWIYRFQCFLGWMHAYVTLVNIPPSRSLGPAGVLLFLLLEGEKLITVLKLASCPPPSSSVKACLRVSLTLSWQCIKPFTWATSLGCSCHLIFLLLVMDVKDSNNKKNPANLAKNQPKLLTWGKCYVASTCKTIPEQVLSR